MSDEHSHHVTVRLARGFEFVAEFNDVPGAPSILFDEPAPLGSSRAPNAAAVLGAAVGNLSPTGKRRATVHRNGVTRETQPLACRRAGARRR